MGNTASMIVTGAERMYGLAEALLKGVGDDRFARLAAPGGRVIEANHPSWVYGHLAIYPCRVLRAAGLDASSVEPSERFLECYENGKPCLDDPEGSIYPSRDEVVDLFMRGYRAAIDGVSGLDDAALAKDHGLGGRMSEVFPTVGHVATFLLLGHTMMHLGQMSTWRRAEGLGSAM